MITICAPVEAVWAQLSDVGGYAEWNPFIVSFEGRLALGARPTIHLTPPGAPAWAVRPLITAVDIGACIEWQERLGRLRAVRIRHRIELLPLRGGRTRLTQSEELAGLLLALPRSFPGRSQAGLAAMNAALRMRTETRLTVSAPGSPGILCLWSCEAGSAPPSAR